MKKEIENQKEKINYLLELIKENPNLKIIPMVSAEIVASDDFGYWAGEWGKANIDEYWVNDERIYFKSTDYEDLVEQYIDSLYYNPTMDNKTDEEFQRLAEEKVENLEWNKAIVVYIV